MTKLLTFITGKNIGLVGFALVVALATFQLDSWIRVNGKVKKIEKLERTVSNYAKSDSTQKFQIKDLSGQVGTLQSKIVSDSTNFAKRTEEFQTTIKALTNRAVFAENIVNEYRVKAPCVDYKGLFNKKRVYVDCPE